MSTNRVAHIKEISWADDLTHARRTASGCADEPPAHVGNSSVNSSACTIRLIRSHSVTVETPIPIRKRHWSCGSSRGSTSLAGILHTKNVQTDNCPWNRGTFKEFPMAGKEGVSDCYGKRGVTWSVSCQDTWIPIIVVLVRVNAFLLSLFKSHFT